MRRELLVMTALVSLAACSSKTATSAVTTTNMTVTVTGPGTVASVPDGIATQSMQSATFSGAIQLSATPLDPAHVFGFWAIQLTNNAPPSIDTTATTIALPPASGQTYYVTAYFEPADAGIPYDAMPMEAAVPDDAGDDATATDAMILPQDASDAAGD